MDMRADKRYRTTMNCVRCTLRSGVVLAALAFLTVEPAAAAGANVFTMPALYDRFAAIKSDMIQAIQAKDHAAMEDACRAGRALLPEDPTFAYNLACALALQGKEREALDTLRTAVALGFRNTEMIRADSDFATLRGHPDFIAAIAEAEAPPAAGVARGMQDVTPALVAPGGEAWVTSTNTVWDFDGAQFKSFFTTPPYEPSATAAGAYKGPAQPLLADWLRTGRAAGNAGDLYDNRDEGHSRLAVADFPGLARVIYGPEARNAGTRPHYGAALFLYNLPTLGNSSTALTQGPFWRSQARMLLVNPLRVAGLFNQYVSNHIYVYPAHQDFLAEKEGDAFPFNAPYLVVSRGSSGSDQPFLRAIAATMAAFTPETKRALVQNRLLAPTVQMILRATQRPVAAAADAYFTGAAHPAVFAQTNLDEEAMVRMANGMTSNTVPPLVTLRVLGEQQAIHGRDFFDGFPAAAHYDSPACVARVFRGVGWSNTLAVAAQAVTLPGATNLTWRWAVLQGDPAKVAIRPLTPSGQAVEITVAYHEPGFPSAADPALRASRVDIGAFAHNGTHPSAPAILSIYFLNNEARAYSDDRRILWVDYASASGRYVDPALSYRRNWKDVYRYDDQNRLTGWVRHHGALRESFTPHGLLVETRDPRGRAKTARAVRYLPRSSANENVPPDLVQVKDQRTFTYVYASSEDTIGRPVADD